MEPTIFQRLTQSTWLRQAVKFGMVGVINTLVDAGVYFALTRWAGMIDLPVLAKAISYSCGVLNSFFWNRLWTFRSKQNSWKNFALFVLVNLIGVGINSSVMAIGMNSLHLIEVVSFLLATAASLGWNFLMSKRVVFRT
ncbi:MAG TPA: GtrA family protein [Longilinea sp.]|nr:GtrA family protein [Longilinea sp.]